MLISNCKDVRAKAGLVRFIKKKSKVSLSQTEKYIEFKNFYLDTLVEN